MGLEESFVIELEPGNHISSIRKIWTYDLRAKEVFIFVNMFLFVTRRRIKNNKIVAGVF